MKKTAQLAVVPGAASVLLIGLFWRDICEMIADWTDKVRNDFNHNRG